VLALEVDYEGDLEPIVQSWTNVYAATDEKHDPARYETIPADRRAEARGIEVGHIFHFGTKYSEPLGAKVSGPNGEMTYVHGGSYGIGVSRLVGAIIEASHDDAGIIWPDSVAPFHVGLVNLKVTDSAAAKFCDDVYAKLRRAKTEVLYDDRDERAGAKFATMDLIGLPWQLVVGPRGLASGTVELKRRATGEKQELSLDAALSRLGL
jgi:prolyl-tRNA synthetase